MHYWILCSSKEPKKDICFKHYNYETRSQNFSNSIYLAIFEMHKLCLMGFYAFHFVACKVSVDTFSLFYVKLLFAKFYQFICGSTLTE